MRRTKHGALDIAERIATVIVSLAITVTIPYAIGAYIVRFVGVDLVKQTNLEYGITWLVGSVFILSISGTYLTIYDLIRRKK